jgi:hypothetical protein
LLAFGLRQLEYDACVKIGLLAPVVAVGICLPEKEAQKQAEENKVYRNGNEIDDLRDGHVDPP